MNETLKRLREPLDPVHIEWRIGQVARSGRSTTLLAYLTSRAVMDRLDEVVGPGNWQDAYKEGPNGGLVCGIGIRTEHGWVWKWDGAENTKVEAVKGGLSDAFKRAAVKWGVGRYLYGLGDCRPKVQGNDKDWPPDGAIRVTKDSQQLGWVFPPRLPAWALPPNTKQAPPPKTEAPRAAEYPASHPLAEKLAQLGVEPDSDRALLAYDLHAAGGLVDFVGEVDGRNPAEWTDTDVAQGREFLKGMPKREAA